MLKTTVILQLTLITGRDRALQYQSHQEFFTARDSRTASGAHREHPTLASTKHKTDAPQTIAEARTNTGSSGESRLHYQPGYATAPPPQSSTKDHRISAITKFLRDPELAICLYISSTTMSQVLTAEASLGRLDTDHHRINLFSFTR